MFKIISLYHHHRPSRFVPPERTRLNFLFWVLFFCSCAITTFGQGYTIDGKVKEGGTGKYLPGATIQVIDLKDSSKTGTVTDANGYFMTEKYPAGKYLVKVVFMGFSEHTSMVVLKDRSVNLGNISMHEAQTVLNEVKIVEKILAVVQKDDTTEYNAGSFKTNPDADAADLVKKMPAIEMNGKEIKAQGEAVVKVLVDGKPFFGTDPYASLRNLPAEIIDKVQVYNEKNEQEQFTGFSEGNTTKTINIITKPDKRNGIFGKAYAGYGDDDTYASGGNLNRFDGDKRITLTAQANNVNVQDFGDQNLTGAPSNGVSVATTKAIGINYSDKLSKKTDISGSYFYNESNNLVNTQTRKTFVLPVDSGQVYNETNNAPNQSYNHRVNLRLNQTIDSMNSILFQPALSLQQNNSNALQQGNTAVGNTLLNQIVNNNSSNRLGYNFTGLLLYKHKFHTRGRTFSLNLTANNSYNDGTGYLQSQSIYYDTVSKNDSLKQKNTNTQSSWNFGANATYTEPIRKTGLLQAQYNINYQPAHSDKQTYDYSYASDSYSIPDTLLSNVFTSNNIAHKAGLSYQFSRALEKKDSLKKKYQFSIGIYYQLTQLIDEQKQPYSFSLDRNFQNFLPTASFHYNISKAKNLQFTYNTTTRAPSVSQLQNVINNNNPLQLSTGNPSLKQPYQHNITIRYNATNISSASNFSASISGNVTQNNIANNSIIAQHDTLLHQNIVLLKGSQLSMPVNISGSETFNAYMGYGLPLKAIRSHVNLNLNASIAHNPAIVNNQTNYQDNKTAGLGVSIGSNISENVDFTVSTNINLSANNNSLNTALNNTYHNEATKAVINLIFPLGFVLNTDVSYQHNSGLSAGYNQDYVLWNIGVGKKFFKKRQGDLRLVVYDILEENKNIQHSITDIYIQDTRSNTLQRYYMLVFTYKIRQFGK